MAMANKLQHGSHECALTSRGMVANGICDICFKDEPVAFACDPCNFDLCKTCSDLPQKLQHHLHPEHPLEFCIGVDDRKTKYMICFGCGYMSSGAFYYQCKKCDFYLDLDCALQKSTVTGWEAKEMLHYSHEHLLRRCRRGPGVKRSCLLCERPVSFSAICYGCVHCRVFFHERCLSLPTQIQHPVHPMHPLKRLDYIQTFDRQKVCNACKDDFVGVPFGCLECKVYLHLKCADALLRGLMHKSHEHRLFFVALRFSGTPTNPCPVCKQHVSSWNETYFHCIECNLNFHFVCLEIPKNVVNKSHHIHQLTLQKFGAEKVYLEYCGVCETMIHSCTLNVKNVIFSAYSCEECDFLGHIECILREAVPSPLYLKDLYSCIKGTTRSKNLKDLVTNEFEDKLMVNDRNHIHVMRPVHMSELRESAECDICSERIQDNPCQCETCSFETHDFCAEMGRQSKYRFHSNHSLTLLPDPPGCRSIKCESCKYEVTGFNLFCRICNFIIHVSCALKDKKMHGALDMGQKIIGTSLGLCIQDKHSLFQVIVSRSYPIACSVCDEKLCGQALSCVTCGDIYHPLCIQVAGRYIFGHPLHSDHMLVISLESSGSKCTACQLNITKYGYRCSICKLSFHIYCMKAVIVPSKIKSHSHYLYNFWNNDLKVTRDCSVCSKPCGLSFYGCIDCMFSAHADCIGFPSSVKNQRHQHTLTLIETSLYDDCSLCGDFINTIYYSCFHCKDTFHTNCIMSTNDHKKSTEEEQLQDIYLMYIERDILGLSDTKGLNEWINERKKKYFSSK